MTIARRPWIALSLFAGLLLAAYAWQQQTAQAEAQRLASLDAKCAAQAAEPPAPFRRALECIGWSPRADLSLPARG